MEMIVEIKNFAKENIEVLGIILGSIIQYMLLYKRKRNKVKFLFTIAIFSIFTALFVVAPINEYFKLEHSRVGSSLYALSGLISLQIISFLTTILPNALKSKALDMIGANYDDNKE
jgi:uncharacterized protein involved in response to NO